ncbi:diguanylate cyclase [Pseudomonas monteilii]
MSERTGKGLSFAKRMYVPRALGTGLGFFCVMIGLGPQQPAWWLWGLLLAHGFLWPHLAYQMARRSAQPFRAEQRSLVCDGLLGGCWAGAMGLNPLPSVIILSMIAMDKIAAGGVYMLVKVLVAQVVGIVLVLWLYAPPLFPETTQQQMLACLPILLIYPMVVGLVCYRITTQLSAHKRTLTHLSKTDSLTGLINHGAWKELLRLEFQRCRDVAHVNTLALIDIDHFKTVNDRYGHLVGDEVLKVISTALTGQLRKSDPAARYGGDEFCVMLPDVTPREAIEVLERLRQAVEAWQDPRLPGLRLSLSIGVAPFDHRLSSANAWLHAADMALYQAKDAGRNRIVMAALGQQQRAAG